MTSYTLEKEEAMRHVHQAFLCSICVFFVGTACAGSTKAKRATAQDVPVQMNALKPEQSTVSEHETIETSLIFNRNAVQKDQLLLFAEKHYQQVTPLLIMETIEPNGVHGHVKRVQQTFLQGVHFEHTPMDIDGNGTVSSQLTVPGMTDARAKEVIESIGEELMLPGGKRFWDSDGLYKIQRESAECILYFSLVSNQQILYFECASC